MALDLAPELLAAQTALSRKPLVKLTSSTVAGGFPLTGTPISNPPLNPATNPWYQDQGVSKMVPMASGAQALFYVASHTWTYNGVDYASDAFSGLKLQVTDTTGSVFGPIMEIDAQACQILRIDALVIDEEAGILGCVSMNHATVDDTGWKDHLLFRRVTTAGVNLNEVMIDDLNTLMGVTVEKTDTGYICIYIRKVTDSYIIYKRTSPDFINWSAETALDIEGRTILIPCQDVELRRVGEGYMLLFSHASEVFATGEIFNIVYSYSTDLITWGPLTAITNTSLRNLDYQYPGIIQRSDDSLFIVADAKSSYLGMTEDTPGWTSPYPLGANNIWVDEAAGKVYASGFYPGVGTKGFHGLAVIDIDTWTIDKCYHTGSIPQVPAIFGPNEDHCFQLDRNTIEDGIATIHSYNKQAACAIDCINDSITTYYFKNYSSDYGPSAAVNVSHEIPAGANLVSSHVYAGKLWLGFINDLGNTVSEALLGYVDLSQNSPPYTFNVVNTNAGAEAYGTNGLNYFNIRFFPDANIALSASSFLDGYTSTLTVSSLSDDTTIRCYYLAGFPDFPEWGVYDAVLVGNKIFALPATYNQYYYDNVPWTERLKWGVLEIDINTDIMVYHTPPWCTTPAQTFSDPGQPFFGVEVNEDATELILRSTNGAATFNYITHVWERFDNTNMLDYPPEDEGTVYGGGDSAAIAYDRTRGNFFWGGMDTLYMVPRAGVIHSMEYVVGTFLTEWTFTPPDQLVVGYNNAYPSIGITADDKAFLTWTNQTGADNVYITPVDSAVDITPYLAGEVSVDLSIDAPNRLSFELSDGHLFDPLNKDSLIRSYLTKGRRITLQFGEKVEGLDYWIDQGKFLVRSLKVSYQRGEYPLIKVECEDDRCLWGMHQTTAVNISDKIPELALSEIIVENTALTVDDVVVPVMPLSFTFDAQWIDTYLTDIIDDIAHRFEHFCTTGVDGKVVFRPFNFSKEATNSYTDGQIIQYAPDDSYSDLTNRITVTGEGLEDVMMVYGEEQVGSLNGTIGWYGYHKDFRINYSEDSSKRAKNPRLKVIESATSVLFKLAGKIKERISEEDVDNRYCVIEVKAPNLIPILVAALSLYQVGNWIGDGVIIGGLTKPIGRKMEGVGLMLALMVLGSIGNFQYEVWGKPIGYIRRAYQSSSDDEELQQEMGAIVQQKQDGFLCHSPEHCQNVADFEMKIARAQRSRVSANKIAHLRDEIGDVIMVQHPYTKAYTKIFLTNILRKYKRAGVDSEGYFTDDVEGWVIL